MLTTGTRAGKPDRGQAGPAFHGDGEGGQPKESLPPKTQPTTFDRAVRVASSPPQPPPADPALLAAQATIEIQRETARADIEIRRQKMHAEMSIAAFKAQQWAEIERLKAGRSTR